MVMILEIAAPTRALADDYDAIHYSIGNLTTGSFGAGNVSVVGNGLGNYSTPAVVGTGGFSAAVGVYVGGVLLSLEDPTTFGGQPIEGNVSVDSISVGTETTISGNVVLGAYLFGNLTLAGNFTANWGADLDGATDVHLGSWTDGTYFYDGLDIHGPAGWEDTALFVGGTPAVTWTWQQSTSRASLDPEGRLMLDAGSSNQSIVFDPQHDYLEVTIDGVSGNVAFSSLGANLPIDGNGSFSVGDGLIVLGSDTLVLGGMAFNANEPGHGSTLSQPGFAGNMSFDLDHNTVAFSNGFSMQGTSWLLSGIAMTLGPNVTASGAGAVAMGGAANANGTNAIAFADGQATAANATALGGNSTASANGSLSLAGGNATGNFSIAIGNQTTASGSGASAIGLQVTSSTWETTVVGHYNSAISGNATTRVATDPAFVIGIGNSTVPRNAWVILNNGNLTINGTLKIAHPSYVSPTSSTQLPAAYIDDPVLFNGQVTFAGHTVKGGSTLSGAIPMGEFNYP